MLEQVNKLKYLGAWITEEGRSETEVKSRIAMAKEAFNDRKELFTKSIKLQLKKKVVKCLVWSVALYMDVKHGS